VLRVWRQENFASFACARCAEKGWARDGSTKSARLSPERVAAIKREAAAREAAEQLKRQRTARYLWSRRLPVENTAAETYLRARACRGPIPATIGYLPASGDYVHAMIGAFGFATEPEPGVLAIAVANIRGVHLTKLNADGSDKLDVDEPKSTIGKGSAGFPICLAPPNDLLGMAITEGIEDALSVYQATGLGVWAAGGAGRMPALADAVPDYIECVTVFAHPERAGQIGATKLVSGLRARGVEVIPHGLPT
jgi:Toprim domain